MSASKDERNRILRLIESGQVNAIEAAQLLDALDAEPDHSGMRGRKRTLRIRATSTQIRAQKMNLSASLPVSLIKVSMRLGTRLLPQLSNSALEDLLRAIEGGAAGRLLDLQDLENGERLEIFVE